MQRCLIPLVTASTVCLGNHLASCLIDLIRQTHEKDPPRHRLNMSAMRNRLITLASCPPVKYGINSSRVSR